MRREVSMRRMALICSLCLTLCQICCHSDIEGGLADGIGMGTGEMIDIGKGLDAALLVAISFAGSEDDIRSLSENIDRLGPGIHGYVKEKFGLDNMSSALLLMSPEDDIEGCRIEFDGDAEILPILKDIFRDGKSLVQRQDISDFKFEKAGDDRIKGGFKFNIKCLSKGNCAFTAVLKDKKWVINTMEILKKEGSERTKGFVLFEIRD